MQQATSAPKNTEISYHDQVHLIDYATSSVDLFLQLLPGQVRLFKSLKLQSYYYVDLEESIGTVKTTKQVYDQILELVTLGSPGYGQGPLGPADIRSATRLPPQPLGPPGVPLRI